MYSLEKQSAKFCWSPAKNLSPSCFLCITNPQMNHKHQDVLWSVTSSHWTQAASQCWVQGNCNGKCAFSHFGVAILSQPSDMRDCQLKCGKKPWGLWTLKHIQKTATFLKQLLYNLVSLNTLLYSLYFQQNLFFFLIYKLVSIFTPCELSLFD